MLSEYLYGTDFPTSVYESNMTQLKELEPEEVEIIIMFYSKIKSVKMDTKDRSACEERSVDNRDRDRKFTEIMSKTDLRNILLNLQLVYESLGENTPDFVYEYVTDERPERELDQWVSKYHAIE